MSSSTTTMTLRYPPPTSNNLDTTQRARLMRSTRKLGDVLGTTPYLVENLPTNLLPIGPRSQSPALSTRSTASCASDKSLKSSRRLGSIFTRSEASYFSSAAPSVTSLALQQSPSSSSLDLPSTLGSSCPRRSPDAHRPRPLVLHLNRVPLSPSDPCVTVFAPTPTPTSTLFSPATPTFNVPESQDAEARRRKMVKITRTLGENIPSELVFPPSQPTALPRALSDSRKQIRTRNRRSRSVSAIDQSQMWSTGSAPSVHGLQPGWVGEWNRKDIKDVQKQLRGLKAR